VAITPRAASRAAGHGTWSASKKVSSHLQFVEGSASDPRRVWDNVCGIHAYLGCLRADECEWKGDEATTRTVPAALAAHRAPRRRSPPPRAPAAQRGETFPKVGLLVMSVGKAPRAHQTPSPARRSGLDVSRLGQTTGRGFFSHWVHAGGQTKRALSRKSKRAGPRASKTRSGRVSPRAAKIKRRFPRETRCVL
jgi:hypothetical protein